MKEYKYYINLNLNYLKNIKCIKNKKYLYNIL